jgi:hypothetical protein
MPDRKFSLEKGRGGIAHSISRRKSGFSGGMVKVRNPVSFKNGTEEKKACLNREFFA